MVSCMNLLLLLFSVVILSNQLTQCQGFVSKSSQTFYKCPTTTSSSSSPSRYVPCSSTNNHHLSGYERTQQKRIVTSRFVSMQDNEESPTIRDKLRKVTGFSLTAFRATWRAATGISLSAIYASTVAVTSLYVRKVMSVILSIFPAWFRYFLQPFLVLYYAPLFILRSLTGPSRERAKAKHERVVESWKKAVKFAEETNDEGYWPVHVSDKGYFELVAPPEPDQKRSDLADAVAESVEAAMEQKEDK